MLLIFDFIFQKEHYISQFIASASSGKIYRYFLVVETITSGLINISYRFKTTMAASIYCLANMRLNAVVNVLLYSSKQKWIPPSNNWFRQTPRLNHQNISRSISSATQDAASKHNAEKQPNRNLN